MFCFLLTFIPTISTDSQLGNHLTGLEEKKTLFYAGEFCHLLIEQKKKTTNFIKCYHRITATVNWIYNKNKNQEDTNAFSHLKI